MTVAPALLALLVCPSCKGELRHEQNPERLECHACRVVYPVRDGIPVMLLDEATPL